MTEATPRTPGGNSKGSRRRFGSIRKLPSKRWQVGYTGPDGEWHRAPTTFQSKGDADTWLALQSAAISKGTWKSPAALAAEARRAASNTFEVYAREVLARRLASGRIRETTNVLYSKLLRLHVTPRFGPVPLSEITVRDVAKWCTGLTGSAASRGNVYGLFRSIMADAMADELIDKNPCRVRGGSAKGGQQREGMVLSPADLADYLLAVPEAYKVPLQLTFWCGLRSGEVRGLRRRDIVLSAPDAQPSGEVRVSQQIVTLRGRSVISPTPKTSAGSRRIALPPHLVPMLRAWLAEQPVAGRDALLWHSQDPRQAVGGTRAPMSAESLRAAHKKGAVAIGRPDLRVHDLRHSAATLAAQSGATTSELMGRFGWDTPSMAARYSHASADRDRTLATALSAMAAAVGQ